MTTPKPAEIWKLKDGKTVRVEYFITTQYLCTIVNQPEYGGKRCILPAEFEHKVEMQEQKHSVKLQKAEEQFTLV